MGRSGPSAATLPCGRNRLKGEVLSACSGDFEDAIALRMLERILAPITAFVLAVISAWGYIGIVACMTIESACIPLPSEIIMPFSGYLITTGRFNLWGVALAGAVGNVLGSWIGYWLGFAGGRPLAERLLRLRIIRISRYHRAERRVPKDRNAAAVLN